MVGYIKLLKMLHCHRKINKKKRNTSNIIIENKKPKLDSPVVKTELIESGENSKCRVCLKQASIPIYGSSENISEALSTFGDIIVSPDDCYTKFICECCYEFLRGAILFRKNAKQSEGILRRQESNTVLDIEDAIDNTHDASSGCDDPTQDHSTYYCKKCLLSFKTFKEYGEHRLSPEHENVKHTCPICKKLYTAEYIKRHMLLHQLDRQFMCDICGKEFPLQAPFQRHRLTHFYSLPFACALCPYKGRFRESLKMHMRTHTGEKPYQCSQCPSRFVNASNLNKHLLTHKRNHDFKCELCGRGFYTKRDLGLHFKVDHTGIKEHVCNICGKAFGYRKQMMKHQLIVHKREKLRSGRMPLYLQVERQDKPATI